MADLRWNFVQTGADDVERAILSIGAATVRVARDVEDAFRGMSAAARRSARSIKEEVERGAKEGADAARKAIDREVRDVQQGEGRKRAARKSAQDEAAREAEKRAAKVQAELDKEVRATERAAQKKADAERRASERIRESGRRALGSIGAGIKSGILTGVATGTALTVGTVGAAARDELKLQETANRISINARQAGQGYIDAATLRREFEATAIATPGVKASEVADAVQRFITLTGDISTARAGQRAFATASSATGAAAGEVAETGASISKNFDIKSLTDMQEAIAALTYQGKAGAFELRDMAALFQRLAASGGAFGLQKGVEGVRILGGITQLARDATGGGEQATTAVENIFTNLATKAEDLKREGVSVYKDGKARDVRDILVEAIAKVGGSDIEKKNDRLSTIFQVEGKRAINPLVMRYNEVYQSTKGSDAERVAAASAAVAEKLRSAIDAPGTWADVVRDAAQAQRDSSAQVTAAFERIKATAGDQLLPALLGLEPAIKPVTDVLIAATPIITSFTEALGGMARFITANFTTGGGDSARRASEAGARVAELQAVGKTRALSAEEQAQLAGAQREQTAATRERDFINRFVAADTSSSKSLTDKQIDAKAYYDRLMKNPEAAASYAQTAAKVGFSVPFLVSGQNDAQAKIVSDEAERVKGERQGAGAPIVQEVEQLKTGLAGFARSLAQATQAASAFNAQQRPSILQGQ